MTDTKPALAVLLVEDNPGDAELARLALAESNVGATVQVADTLQSALARIETAPADVILLDLGLPDASGLDGVELFAHQAPMTPIIVLSGHDNQKTALRALESGAQDYLVKGDYTPELLARTVRYALERKRTERELLEAARFDGVTGLVNRSYFLCLLEHALDRARRNETAVNVLYLDLDHFKNINDSFGHAAGDVLLRQFGKRLRKCVRTSDVVARLGGDEFTIMVEDAASASAAAKVAENVLAALRPAFLVDGVDVVVTPSIGIAGFADVSDDVQGRTNVAVARDGGSDDVHTLLRNADTAMYRAKSKGRNRFEFFSDDMNTAVRESFDLEWALGRALRENEFELHYQPIIDCAGGDILAVEALLRWRREVHGEPVGPEVFLATLEKTGLIREVGDWVLQTACAQCRIWQKSLQPSLRLTVNVSPKQVAVRDFSERIANVLRDTQLAPASLELDITEQVLIEISHSIISTLSELRSMGVAIALDDFGAGYASLDVLAAFQFDTVKIDNSFIKQLDMHSDNKLITSGIASIARGLGRQVIAEGVETRAQLDFLTEHGCHGAQGFIISKPLSASDFEDFYEQPLPVGMVVRG